jgi:hypothetical protein
VEEVFYRRNLAQWREEQAQIRARIERHEKADENYIEQGGRSPVSSTSAWSPARTAGLGKPIL